MHSSRTTTTGAITRASTISPRPTSTSGAVKPSYCKEKGSNARPSKTVGCFTANKPRNINHDAPDSLLVHSASCLKISDDGQFKEMFANADAPDPHDVAAAIAKLIDAPKGTRPARVVVGQAFGADNRERVGGSNPTAGHRETRP